MGHSWRKPLKGILCLHPFHSLCSRPPPSDQAIPPLLPPVMSPPSEQATPPLPPPVMSPPGEQAIPPFPPPVMLLHCLTFCGSGSQHLRQSTTD